MTPRPWEMLGEEQLVHYKVFDVRKSTRRSPRNGRSSGFFLIDTLDWVNVVAFTDRRELIMIQQYRHGSESVTLEIPGGVVHEGEDPRDGAFRELREETGYAATEMIHLGDVNPNPALFRNRCSTYLAVGCRHDGELMQDPGEDIEVELVPFEVVDRRVAAGDVNHSLVITALYYYDRYLRASDPGA